MVWLAGLWPEGKDWGVGVISQPGVPRDLVKHHAGCVCEGFLDRINIRIHRPSDADHPPQCGWALSNQLKA